MHWRSNRPDRGGFTSGEFFGIAIALGLGIVIGLYYLRRGDFPLPIIGAISEKENEIKMVDSLESELAATNEVPRVEDFKAELRRLRKEMKSLREERNAGPISEAPNSVSQVPLDGHAVPNLQNTALTQRQLMGRRTLAYWRALNEIMATEEATRQAPSGGLTQANVADFLSRRGQAGKFAARAFRKLNPTEVDPEVVRHVSDLAAWYEKGTQLNQTADFLLHQADGATRRGSAGSDWGNAEKQHNQAVNGLNRRGDLLRQKMIEKYGLAFPDLK